MSEATFSLLDMPSRSGA